MADKFYITTTLPYVNAEPHLGFAMEIVQADILARYHRLIGDEVIFNFGTDEHGAKIYKTATAQGKDPQQYADEYAPKFDELKKSLNLSYTNFIRTTNPDHKKAAQEFWKRCQQNGDIYKATYKIKYCVGCELEKTDSELVDGRCPLHPNMDIEIREEENYFFKFSNYQKSLLEFYKQHPDFVLPDFRFKEIKQFTEDGLQDFSISRLKEKMPWGVDVPNDPEHVMYVWFDALVNYISTLGWPKDEENFNAFWPGIQVAGKDNLRQQSAMWQAMLMSAKLPNSKQVVIHGFITSNGQKMSKSLGNVIHPYDLVQKYGTDATRFFIGYELNTFEDSDVTPERIQDSYTANLVNGLGNLVSRIAKLCENNSLVITWDNEEHDKKQINPEIKQKLEEYKFNEALGLIWNQIRETDRYLNETEPWKYGIQPIGGGTKEADELHSILDDLVDNIRHIAIDLQPFLPETSAKILKLFSGEIKSSSPLFPRV